MAGKTPQDLHVHIWLPRLPEEALAELDLKAYCQLRQPDGTEWLARGRLVPDSTGTMMLLDFTDFFASPASQPHPSSDQFSDKAAKSLSVKDIATLSVSDGGKS